MQKRDCSRKKEIRLLVEKISELTSALVDRKPEINLHPIKNVSTDTEHSMLLDPETKEKTNEKVSWDKKIKPNKEKGSESVSLQSAVGSARKKRVNAEISRTSKNFTKAATFDGTTSWIDHRSHFGMCAEINNWTNQQKRRVSWSYFERTCTGSVRKFTR